MRGREGPGGTVVNTLIFSQKTWENMCVCVGWGGDWAGVGWRPFAPTNDTGLLSLSSPGHPLPPAGTLHSTISPECLC